MRICGRLWQVPILAAVLGCGTRTIQAQPSWVQQSPATSPDYREASWMTWDPLHKQIVMFGGCTAANCPGNDTWVWDGQNWTQKFPAQSPPARFRHCMLYDPAHQQVVMFGGEGNSGFLNDTWVWDGTNWTQKNPAASPIPEDCYASFAYDEVHQQAILFGETSSVSLAGKTWSWDGTNWTQLNPATVPPYGGTPILVYDRGHQQLVLATYSDNPSNNSIYSTWTWDGSNWNRKSETGFLPFDYNPSEGVYDPVTKQILVFLEGPQTWEWDGSGWFQIATGTSPADRILPALAFDEVNQQVVLFGGSGAGPSALANDTWTYGFPTLDWTAQSPPATPPARAFVAMTYDGKNNNVVLFGGRTTGNVYLGDTWTYNGTTWTQASSSQNPAARDLPAMAYDAHNQQVVLFGGFGTAGPVGGYFADTWIWNGSSWTQKTPAHSPPAQAFHSMVYDSVLQRVVLFSGITCCNAAVTGDTWTWDGTDWTHQTPATNPPETNAYSVAAFDGARGATLRFDTYFSSPGYHPSTWTYNGTNWTSLSPTHSPAARILDATLAYDSQRQQITMFGGSDANSSTYNSDTWLWNGFDWTQIGPAHHPSPRAGFGYAYDPVHNNTVLFGGDFNDSNGETYYNDTWILSPATASSGTTPVTITVPTGVQFTFNGVSYTGTHTLNIASGNYALSTATTQIVATGTQATFVSWSDAGAITHNVFVGSTPLSITGTFSTQYLLTATAVPSTGGTLSGGGYNNAGSTAMVTETPNSNFAFTGWGGACSGTGSCTVVMNAPATVSANFTATTVQFTINVPAGIQFTFNGTTYTGTQTVTVAGGAYPLSTASPQPTGAGTQAVFVSWSDAGAISHNVSLTLPVQSITATFNTQYLLTTVVSPPGAGILTAAGGPYYNAGAVVTVSESPNAGYEFDYWGGACAGSGACMVTMNAPVTVIGNFNAPSKWVQLGPVNTPNGRDLAGTAYDTARGETILFGGSIGDLFFTNETWTWNGSNWTLKTPATSPSPRGGFAMAYDPAHGQTVLFGGLTGTNTAGYSRLNETWVWDGSNWTQRSPATSPSPRQGVKMAWDGSRIILFGGFTQSGLSQETWAWDGSNWTLLSPSTVPTARWYPTMTYDAARNQLVMFGGETLSVTLGDTWIWNGTNWSQRTPGVSPPTRAVAMAAYDAAIQQVVLFSGFTSTFAIGFPNEVWLWDGNTWKQQSQSPSPAPQFGGTMSYDEARRQVVLFGGNNGTGAVGIRNRETWIYANNAIQQFFTLSSSVSPSGAGTVASSAPGQAGPVFRAGSEVTVTASSTAAAPFGYWTGACATQGNPCNLRMIADTSVTANYPAPPKWIQLGPVNSPPGRTNAGLVFDTSQSEAVFFGGLAEVTGLNSNQTWTWDGTNWSMQHPSVSPSPRSGHAMAFDPGHNLVVLFGGGSGSGELADTWVWNTAAGTWTQLSPAHSPSAREGARLEWDGTRLILFGGQTTAGASSETWAWNGTDWTQLAPAIPPPARAYGSMTYDPIRHQIVLFGGETMGAYTGLLGDTWTWDGANWTQRTPSTSPAPRSRSVLSFHGLIQKAVLFSGYSSSFAVDTWLWDGTNWTQRAEPVSPDLQWHSAMTYDSARQQVLLLAHYAGDLRSTWIYANNAVQQFVTLTVVASPTTGGTVAGSGTYRAGQLVFVTESPASGLEFQGWSGACSGSEVPCSPSLSGNQTVTASFGYPLSWLKLNPATNAAPNESQFFENPASMVYDRTRNQIVYFGGAGGSQTWIWNGSTWSQRTPVHSPPARGGAALAFDEAHQLVVLFGGATSAGVTLNDTWTWDGNDWTQMSTPTAPPIRANHSMTYDRARQQVVLFGGWDYTTALGFNFRTDTWTWNGSAWTLAATTGPTGRSDFGMAYDSANQLVVLTPGAEGGNDTWVWDGTTWRLVNTGLPNGGGFHIMAYDERLQRMTLAIENGGTTIQTWSWDGITWTQLSPVQSVPLRYASGLAYDGVRGEILLFGGDPVFNDTWVFAPPTVILASTGFSVAKDASGNYLVTTVLKNSGNATANTVFALNATLGTVTSFTITTPQFVSIAPGASINITAKFPPSAGPGAKPFSIGGGYSVAGSTGNWSAAVRSVTLP